MVLKTKQQYYSNLFNNDTSKQNLFKIVNKIIKKPTNTPYPEHTNSEILAEEFSSFFKSKIENIRKNFDSYKGNPLEMDIKSECNLSSFSTVNSDELYKIIKNSPNKTCNLDPAPTSIVKQCAGILSQVIARLVNLTISTGNVPNTFKKAIVSPLIKKPNGDTSFTNYRPISNLPFISKVAEKVIANQMNSYIKENKLDEPLQSAYKKKHSTHTALIKVFNDILIAVDNKKVVLLTLLDLSAAFDTVDHSILLSRLEHTLGISDSAKKWFKSYLTNRTQEVVVNGKTSKSKELDCCVPQGSILGADLYSEYTIPLGELLRILELLYHFYADDSQLIKIIDPNNTSEHEKAKTDLQNNINRIRNWMGINKLQLYSEKTELLIIGSKAELQKVKINELKLGNDIIIPKPTVRNLGVMMDNELKMADHIQYTSKKCYAALRNIYKIRRFITVDATKQLVHACVISNIDYCNVLLYGLPSNILSKLQRIPN